MSGPIALTILAALIIVLWKFRVQIRNFWWPAGAGAQAPQQPAAAQAAAGNPPAARPARDYGWVWTALFAVAAIAVLYFWVYNDPSWSKVVSAADLHAWAWDRWVGILVLAGILWALVELNAARLGGAAHVLRQMLLWGVLALFIGSWVMSWFTPTQKTATVQRVPAQKVCPDMSSTVTSTCPVTTDWSDWIRMEDGARNSSVMMCHSLGVESERRDQGATMVRFRVDSGRTTVKYRLFPLGTSCSMQGF